MRDEERFEIERAFDLLPHVVGASWAVIWFRLKGVKKPSREEFRNKVVEYYQTIEPIFSSLPESEEFGEINTYIKKRHKVELEKIKNGSNKEIEKRYDRYVDYG